MMEPFRELGDRVTARWRARRYDELAFPEIAEEALRELPPAEHVATYEPLKWLCTTGSLPRQIGIEQREQFGQPPVQVYVGRRFYIEVLYWMDGTTSIHEHSFNGAFQVLAGSSIHCLYTFDETERYNASLKLGNVRRTRVELLAKGDTRRILAGSAMSHSLFHLDRPSVTVVVRSFHVPGSAPQYNYVPPGIAFDPFVQDDFQVRVSQAIHTLHQARHPEMAEFLLQAFREADPLTFFHLATKSDGYFERPADHVALLERARDRHGELVDALKEAIEERRRQTTIINLRRKLRSPEHRFFLALLLNFTRGQEILELVRERHPDREPAEVVLAWMNQCAELTDPEDPTRKVFDLDFDGSMLDVMKTMLCGRPFEDVVRVLGSEFDPDDVREQTDDLLALHRALRGNAVFSSLFR